MTSNELNQYIQHYIEKDHTNRAMMLTGPWGCGKSYYIREELIPYLLKEEHGGHSCIVVSLYGLTNLQDVSKAVFMEARFGRAVPKSEKGYAGKIAAKTILKNVANLCGFDLAINDSDLQKLYESVDLTGRLVVFEDVERTQIGIFELLGYVNNLTEQDRVKVLLVTNETEFIHYKPLKVADESDRKRAELFARVTGNEPREYTEETQKYLEVKEKTVGDTIQFEGDIETAVKHIMREFSNDLLCSFANDVTATDIKDIMVLMRSCNLRSIVFACQKTVDTYERIPKENNYKEDFFRTIFYGITFFSLRMHKGDRIKWIGMDQYSFELGGPKHPLFRFCFDYIMTQQINETQFPIAAAALDRLRLYDETKTLSDPDLQKVSGYYLFSEQDVCKAVKHITERLHKPGDISFYDYGRLTVGLIEVKHRLGIDISEAKDSLIHNLKGRGRDLPQEKIFGYYVSKDEPEMANEYAQIRSLMIESMKYSDSVLSDFDYRPENANQFYHLVIDNDKQYYEQQSFAKHLNISRLIDMFMASSPAQMNDIRGAFISLYGHDGAKLYLSEDADAIRELLHGLVKKRESVTKESTLDKVQLLHVNWFIEWLSIVLKNIDS